MVVRRGRCSRCAAGAYRLIIRLRNGCATHQLSHSAEANAADAPDFLWQTLTHTG